ncbi:hypothetical protein KEG38_26425 [Polyangium jinanense]|uniref:hypothetical protein n=1 Tax=Polyangium jinanense TaxID=2829994 RepID=UPI0023407303|nr:hypothetical protein [Polyangium jinanense]MDC3957421.1 hypothetical protein [Polyangium jinanense]
MKTEVKVLFAAQHIPGGLEAVFGPAGIPMDVAEVQDFTLQRKRQIRVNLTLDETDKRLSVLLDLLKTHGISWLERRYDCFTDEELESTRLLVMWYDVNAEVFAGPRVGTTYDVSEACNRCGAGARQTSAMIIDGEYLHRLEGRRAAATCYDDMLVDEKLAGTLAESGLIGISFRGVFAAFEKRGHIQLPWRQICATHTMPPLSPRSTGIEGDELCSCGRSGFLGQAEVPLRLVYRASDLVDIRDVNVTWEWFGDFHFEGDVSDALFPSPLFLVTPKVWRIFRDAGVTGFDWIPIQVVDE